MSIRYVMSCDCRVSADDIERHFLWSCDLLLEAAFRIHLILTRIRILGSTFGKSGSGSSEPPFRNSGSGSLDPHLEKVDPVPKWIRIRVPIFHKEIHVGQIKMLIFITAKI